MGWCGVGGCIVQTEGILGQIEGEERCWRRRRGALVSVDGCRSQCYCEHGLGVCVRVSVMFLHCWCVSVMMASRRYWAVISAVCRLLNYTCSDFIFYWEIWAYAASYGRIFTLLSCLSKLWHLYLIFCELCNAHIVFSCNAIMLDSIFSNVNYALVAYTCDWNNLVTLLTLVLFMLQTWYELIIPAVCEVDVC